MKIKWGQTNTYQHLSPQELRKLLLEAKKHSERDWLMLLVMYLHGLRVSELTAITKSDVQGGNIRIQRLKNGYLNIHPMFESDEVLMSEAGPMRRLASLASEPGTKLFKISRFQIYRLMRHYCELIGLPPEKCHPHVLRHSIAMHTIGPSGVHNVRQWLGQRSISSTSHYLRASDEDAAAKVFAVIKPETI